MKIKGIDPAICTSCLECAKACPAGLFSLNGERGEEKREITRKDPNGWCTGCGHCISACPRNAIQYVSDEMAEEFEGVQDPPSLCSYDTLLKVMKSKRSVRNYRDEKVPQSKIEAILEAMKYAPTGHNLQVNHYVVVRDPEKIRSIIDATVRGFYRFKKIVKLRKLLKPFLNKHMYAIIDDPGLSAGLDELILSYLQGKDHILHSAPVIIISYYPSLGPLSLLDPTIAFTYGMLAAHTLGLGTCWIGFAIQVLYKNRRLKRYLEIPKEMIVSGVMTLGYPSVKYYRIPLREQSKVKWY